MPELPDVTVYIDCLRERLEGRVLEGVRLASPFLLRSVDPPPEAAIGRRVTGFRRLGKRIAIGFEDGLYLVFHLMIAGRFRWKERGADLPKKLGLAAFDFEPGALLLTEAGTKKRASLHVVQGEEALAAHDPGVHGSGRKSVRHRPSIALKICRCRVVLHLHVLPHGPHADRPGSNAQRVV